MQLRFQSNYFGWANQRNFFKNAATCSKRSSQRSLKLRFQRAFIACICVFKEITLAWANQRNVFENATASIKRMRKTLVTTQL